MCKVELKKDERVFLITMSGSITEKYIGEVKENIKEINPIQYNIVVDSRSLNINEYYIVGKMMEMINEIPFKHVKILC